MFWCYIFDMMLYFWNKFRQIIIQCFCNNFYLTMDRIAVLPSMKKGLFLKTINCYNSKFIGVGYIFEARYTPAHPSPDRTNRNEKLERIKQLKNFIFEEIYSKRNFIVRKRKVVHCTSQRKLRKFSSRKISDWI